MLPFVAAFGRFTIKELIAAAQSLPFEQGRPLSPQEAAAAPAPDPLAGAWGIAWCYGDRLEHIRSNRPHTADPEFAKLAEVRSDMALICLHPPLRRLKLREVQPFVRREPDTTWAFLHYGRIDRPDLLDTGHRLPDGPSPSERYFLHILNRLDLDNPAESVLTALQPLSQETSLAFVLISPQTAIVCSGTATVNPPAQQIYLGRSELLRLVAPGRLTTFEDVRWEVIPIGQTIAVLRERRALAEEKPRR